MGLNITAYSNLEHVGIHTDEWCTEHVVAFAYDAFPASFRGLPILATNLFGQDGFISAGCYRMTEDTQDLRFQAGSYRGYNLWRANLQERFNPDRDPAMPALRPPRTFGPTSRHTPTSTGLATNSTGMTCG